MARGINRLSAQEVKNKAAKGYYADGGGLYLQVSAWGTRSWVFKLVRGGRQFVMGLGAEDTLPLKAARIEAEKLRIALREGRDPIAERDELRRKLKAQADVPDFITFKDAIDKCHARKEGEFRSEKHKKDWRSSLDMHAAPKIGHMDVAHITTQDVLRVLSQPVDDDGNTLWETKTETASRLRQRIEAVLSWATVAGYRSGDNPARWAGNLKELLPKPSKVAKKDKQPALSQADLPAWFKALRQRDGFAARALEFATLCASRSGEVRGATWDEIDLEARMWKIPAARMKMERDHRVPLTDAAVTLLEALPRMAGSPYVFPAARGGMLSDMALSQVMRRMHEAASKDGGKGWIDPDSGRPAVPHGQRAVFRIWTAEHGYDRDMSEMALAHNVGSAVERSYQRSDMIDRRRAQLADWSAFCHGQASADNVVQLRGAV